MTARPRALGPALAASLLVLAGCGQAASPVAAPATRAAAASGAPAVVQAVVPVAAQEGRVEIRVSGLAARALMATTADIERIKVTLSGGPLAAPVSKEVTASALRAGKGTVAFEAVPKGTVAVKIEVLDDDGAKIGEKAASATVTGGQTAVVALALQLAATHVASENGNLALDLEVQDGEVIVDPIASPSPRPSTPVLSPAPSIKPATFALVGEAERTWLADGTMKVAGKVKNAGGVAADATVTIAFKRQGLFGWKTVETRTVALDDVGAGKTASFSVTSTEKVTSLLDQGAADVTITQP